MLGQWIRLLHQCHYFWCWISHWNEKWWSSSQSVFLFKKQNLIVWLSSLIKCSCNHISNEVVLLWPHTELIKTQHRLTYCIRSRITKTHHKCFDSLFLQLTSAVVSHPQSCGSSAEDLHSIHTVSFYLVFLGRPHETLHYTHTFFKSPLQELYRHLKAFFFSFSSVTESRLMRFYLVCWFYLLQAPPSELFRELRVDQPVQEGFLEKQNKKQLRPRL